MASCEGSGRSAAGRESDPAQDGLLRRGRPQKPSWARPVASPQRRGEGRLAPGPFALVSKAAAPDPSQATPSLGWRAERGANLAGPAIVPDPPPAPYSPGPKAERGASLGRTVAPRGALRSASNRVHSTLRASAPMQGPWRAAWRRASSRPDALNQRD